MSKKKNDKVKTKPNRKPIVEEGPVKKLKILSILLIIIAGLGVVYWILFYATSIFFVKGVDFFTDYRGAFLLGGIWLIIISLVAGIKLYLRREESLLYGLIAGGSLITMALISINANIGHDVYTRYVLATGLEAFFNIFALIFGIVLLTFIWNNRYLFMEEKLAGPKPPVKKRKK